MKNKLILFATAFALCVAVAGPALGQGYSEPDGTRIDNPRPRAGDTIHVSFHGFGALRPVQIWMHSDPVLLSETTASESGTVSADVVIPAQTAPGSHELFATGQGPGGDLIRESIPITVRAAGSPPRAIAFTGSNAGNMLALGAMLIVVGSTATMAARRRTIAAYRDEYASGAGSGPGPRMGRHPGLR